MTRKWLWMLGIALLNPGSGPTTLSLAADGTVWFTQAGANRIAYLTFT